MSQPTLVILAAGMGSRYGGMKQIDGVGNHGEPIIEFSIYDAKQAGFENVVLIIKREHEEAFRQALTNKLEGKINVRFAYQDMCNIPEGFTVPEGRVKPWGTTHALLACKGIVDGPFAIINADDFYGRDAYKVIYDFLTTEVKDNQYAMVGYPCINTLTDNGTVTRGLCQEDENKCLASIVEIQKIAKKDGHAVYEDNGEWKEISDNSLVSMNFWGFTPWIFEEMETYFHQFLRDLTPDALKAECLLPVLVDRLITAGKLDVAVLHTDAVWFGVTYQEDRPIVAQSLRALHDEGVYPPSLKD